MRGNDRPRSGNAGIDSYYDVALAVLPLPILLGLLAGKLLALPSRIGLSIGAVLSALALGHLLFRDPPTRRDAHGRPPSA